MERCLFLAVMTATLSGLCWEAQALEAAERVAVLDGSVEVFDTVYVPEGIELLELPVDICPAGDKGAPTHRESERRVDLREIKSAKFSLELDLDGDGCEGMTRDLQIIRGPDLFALQNRGAATLWFDARVVEHEAKDGGNRRLLVVQEGRVLALADCAGGEECSLALDDGVLRELVGGRAFFVVWPSAVPAAVGSLLPAAFRADGALVRLESLAAQLSVVFDREVIAGKNLDTAADHHELPIRYPGAVSSVSCDYAECRVSKDAVLLFHIDPAAPFVKLRYTLAEGFRSSAGKRQLAEGSIKLDLERCSVRAPEVPLLAGTSDHRFFVRIPRECSDASIEDIVVQTRPATQVDVRRELLAEDSAARVLELVFQRVPPGIENIRLMLFEKNGELRRLGDTRIRVSNDYEPVQVSLKVDGIGVVSVIPSNRNAALGLRYETASWLDDIEVADRPGFYQARRRDYGWQIRGEEGVSGNVPLRLEYRPAKAMAFLTGEGEEPPSAPVELVSFETDVVFPVTRINIPQRLIVGGKASFFHVTCGTGADTAELTPGKLERISFSLKDSCRIVFERDRIPLQAGTQRLRVHAGGFNEIILLEPGTGPLTVAVPAGDPVEYDTLNVLIAHDLLSGHYALGSSQKLGEEVRYRILLSDSWIRISVTTALPTGLFRFGPKDIEGSVPLSAGALARIAVVQKSGRDFPVGLEMGPFGTDLSGSAGFSVVAGVGLSVPVLNRNTALQASFNIHAWLEYSPTRDISGETPLAFLFGPSFTVGQVSTTF